MSKNILIIVGAALAGYGAYRLCVRKGNCSCSESTTVKKNLSATEQIYPSQAVETSDTSWHSIFPTPDRIVPDDVDAQNPVASQNALL